VSEPPTVVDIEARFAARGPYMVRRGPAYAGDPQCPVNKKLCLTATDRETLIRELDALAARPECFFVKYSIGPRDGMYLGRAFFTDANLLGKLWAHYKAHPRLMCSVQDDDWTSCFR
jgi:hypothetical protein